MISLKDFEVAGAYCKLKDYNGPFPLILRPKWEDDENTYVVSTMRALSGSIFYAHVDENLNILETQLIARS